MRLSNLSKRTRFLLGGVLVGFAYVPAFLGSAASSEVSCASAKGACCAGETFVDEIVCDINYANVLYSRLEGVDPTTTDLIDDTINSDRLLPTVSIDKKSPLPEEKKITTVKNEISKVLKKTNSENAADPIEIIKTGEFAGAKVVKSSVKSSFYVDARKLGVPANVVDAVVKNMSSKIDFRRSLKAGDSFEILYSKKNELLYSKISTKHREVALYRFSDGKAFSYFFANGERVQQRANASASFFGAPLSGKLLISDPYGRRKHPVTGRYHVHTGVDFRAPYGSPVYAIYDGVVTRASYYSGYGHCVDIRHPNGYSSRYGHLSKYAVRCGTKVKKGQVIGSLGSSGISTGPHVHLELARNNVVMNPLHIKMMPTTTAKQVVSNMKAFRSFIGRVDSILKSKQKRV
ncbi:hypothetical protein FACS1894122_13310 [Alphaproteobacteria bacterium]|nr:hypothetical protein FACS1894122_13310 [Alphaproteobacteria bacterium]